MGCMNKKALLFAGGFLVSLAGLFAGASLTFATSPACSPAITTYDSGDTSYTVLSFTQTGTACTWTKPTGLTSLDYLIVAGGGGGGGRHGGGGGGGGVLSANAFDVSNISETSITVGAGGNGSPYLETNTSINSTSDRAQRGGSSVAFGFTATGGGPGAGKATAADFSGGSGGGSDSNYSNAITRVGVTGQGHSGGAGVGGSGEVWSGGGGGGAGGVGGNASSPNNTVGRGGAGGPGLSSSITGTSLIYAAGGGGGTLSDGLGAGAGGSSGIGGAGGDGAGGSNGVDGRGGGGGGAGHVGSIWALKGGDGGDGIVIIRYIAPPRFLKVGEDTDLNQNPVLLVDPRSSSVPIPFLRLNTATNSRVCVDLFTNSTKNANIELKNNSAASSFHRLAISNSASGITSVEGVTVNSSTGMKLTGNRSDVVTLLNPAVSANESYLRLYKPDSGWVDGSVLRIRADYATGSDCSGVSGSEVAVDAQIKIVGLDINQRNEVSVN